MKATAVVDLFDEPWQPSGDVLERLVACQVDLLDLQRLHEALGLGVVVWIGHCARSRCAGGYPMLREIAWSTDPMTRLTPAEAFAIYERNWRHLDRDAMEPKEQDRVARLTAPSARE